MGCVSSKPPESVTPDFHHFSEFRDNVGSDSGLSLGGNGGFAFELKKKSRNRNRRSESGLSGSELSESRRTSSNGGGSGESLSFSLGNLYKYVEGEQVAAGWPGWLSSVAGEAIYGWVPRCADSFEKLEKIGQGTYSSVFRARDLDTGRIVALKKVQFNCFETESVRFMAREILILRRLDHPNIIKLEGIVTSRSSCSIYLVFEYMEHDISGLLSSPDIKFSEAQVKCYMKQLLSGLEHCHSRGVMHRDIKGANLLVNNEGIIKMGDFGLANFCNAGNRYPLTSRVVTLWYRPPELLLGSTDYGAYVDLWSVGCVFAELLLGNPVLQGRTEVEQLHKIFKLCGSPPEDYWKTTKLPHATLFKPQHPYESCLWETFKELPNAAVNLLEALLSVEPCKRGTASSALSSEYFTTKPFASDPSCLPKYTPSKEIDAKHREEVKRKIPGGRKREPESTRKLARKPINISKLAPEENLPVKTQKADKINGSGVDNQKEDIILALELLKPSIDVKEDASHIKHASHGDIPYSGPVVSGSSGFAWAKGRIDYSSILTRSRSTSRSLKIEPFGASHLHSKVEAKRHEYGEVLHENLGNCTGSYELAKHGMLKKGCELDRPDSFDSSDGYHSHELSPAHHRKEEMAAKRFISTYQEHGDEVEFSGPLLSESHKVDELLERHERQIRQAVQRTWFQLPNRRANNTEIMLTKVKMPLPDMMAAALAMDETILDADQVENLIKFCPVKEEMELLKGYTGDKENLGKCEQLMKVPRVESKLRVFLFKIQFNSQISDFTKSLKAVNAASEEVRNSVKLKEIMKKILYLGNTLNQGTARGSAVGFKLDSLLKLIDTRATNNKMTLMHYLCKVLASKTPALLDFHEDLFSLEPASKIQLKSLAEEMQAIIKGLEKVKQELDASENDGPVSNVFHKTLKEFIGVAETEVASVTSLYSVVGRNADALALYFGEDPARCPFEQMASTIVTLVTGQFPIPEQIDGKIPSPNQMQSNQPTTINIFLDHLKPQAQQKVTAILLNFVRMFRKAHDENCKQAELEKKKAQKEAEMENAKGVNLTKKRVK